MTSIKSIWTAASQNGVPEITSSIVPKTPHQQAGHRKAKSGFFHVQIPPFRKFPLCCPIIPAVVLPILVVVHEQPFEPIPIIVVFVPAVPMVLFVPSEGSFLSPAQGPESSCYSGNSTQPARSHTRPCRRCRKAFLPTTFNFTRFSCACIANLRQYRIILSADTASEVRQLLSQKRR